VVLAAVRPVSRSGWTARPGRCWGVVGDAGGAALVVEGGVGVGGCVGRRVAGRRGAGAGAVAAEGAPRGVDGSALRVWASARGVGVDVGGERRADPAFAPHEGVAGGAQAARGAVAGGRSVQAFPSRPAGRVAGRSSVGAVGPREAPRARGGGRAHLARAARDDAPAGPVVVSLEAVVQAGSRFAAAAGGARPEARRISVRRGTWRSWPRSQIPRT
jgi:hypothetical protein